MRSIYRASLAGKIKTFLVFNTLRQRWRSVLHIQARLLNSLELRGEIWAGDRQLGAVSILMIFKSKSVDEITKG